MLLERQDGLQQGADGTDAGDGSSSSRRRALGAAASRPGPRHPEGLCFRSSFGAPRRGELSCRMRLFWEHRREDGEGGWREEAVILSLFLLAGGVFYRERGEHARGLFRCCRLQLSLAP